jgi:hypothetical protein
LWGVQHFRRFTFGRRFKAVTDHKPLTLALSVTEMQTFEKETKTGRLSLRNKLRKGGTKYEFGTLSRIGNLKEEGNAIRKRRGRQNWMKELKATIIN